MAWCCYLSALSAFKLPALQPETRLLSTSLWGAEGEEADTAPALSQGQPALMPHGKEPHLSHTRSSGLFPENTRTMFLQATAVPHDLPVSCYLLMCSL